jgi:5-hydroxyisourate hydrolase-like protein (transthyretin family)
MNKRGNTKNRGVIYDTEGSLPVAFAVVRVYDKMKKLVTETVSDIKGRYLLNVANGDYWIEISHSDFNVLSSDISVKSEDDLNRDFGLVKKDGTLLHKINWGIKVLLDTINRKWISAIIIIGFLFSLFCLIANPELLNIVIVSLYLFQFAFIFLSRLFSKETGIVYDAETGKKLKGVFVKIYSISESRQLESTLTREDGRYGFNLPDGKYKIAALKAGYVLDTAKLKAKISSSIGSVDLIECSIKNGKISLNIPLRLS